MDLMYCAPILEPDGSLVAKPWGGKRRVDRIAVDPDCSSEIIGAAFISVLAGLTDHIPFVVTLREKREKREKRRD